MHELRRIDPRKYPIGRGHQAAVEGLYEELEWYATGGEPPRLLGLVLRDRFDNDYSWVILACGANLQYRAIDMKVSIASQALALDALKVNMRHWMAKSDRVLDSALQ